MRAAVHERYGGPEAIELRELAKPEPDDDAVLVRVHAASLNRADWYSLTGAPYVGRLGSGLRRPKEQALGGDFAGVVEAVGKDVTDLAPGDEVYGTRTGALAGYVSVRKGVGPKPANLTFEEAAALPIAALTALQGLRDKGQLREGQRVLVNGAAGGVGLFAVQIAKALGASEVGAVCSTANVELVRSVGADHVFDYTQEDFTRSGRTYDLIADVAGGRRWSDLKRVLDHKGTLVIIGAPLGSGLMLRGLLSIGTRYLGARRGERTGAFFVAQINKPDLATLRDLVEQGKVRPVVEKTYALDEVADAYRYLGTGHVHSKLVVTL